MIRVTSGQFRGRLLKTPSGFSTRPSSSLLRQALFNSLQAELVGADVLDLFAGSGALGIEAISRGAEQVTFVEKNAKALLALRENLQTLKIEEKAQVIGKDVALALPRFEEGLFDLIVADPPYEGDWESFLLAEKIETVQGLLRSGGVLVIEWGTQKSKSFDRNQGLPETAGVLTKFREKIYGDSALTTYIKEA